jgi:hypothetical protein
MSAKPGKVLATRSSVSFFNFKKLRVGSPDLDPKPTLSSSVSPFLIST